MISISSKFEQLISKQMKLEDRVFYSVNKIFVSMDEKYREKFESDWPKIKGDLMDLQNDLLRSICQIASQVVSKNHRGNADDVSVNIKLISPSSSQNDATYEVVSRSSNSDSDRDGDDDNTKSGEHLVRSHRVYHNLIMGSFNSNETAYCNGDVCIIDNVSEYSHFRKIENESNLHGGGNLYSESSELAEKFYKSSFTVLIKAGHVSRSINSDQTGMDRYTKDGMSCIGIICIDSKTSGYFDSEYDILIMRQLAQHASSAIRSVYEVLTIQDAIKYSLEATVFGE